MHLLGEHESLSAIHNQVPTICPKPFGWGEFSDSPGTYFLVVEFLNLRGYSASGPGGSLAAQLAKLHSKISTIPDGYDKPQFGFPVTTCCGDTPQDNSFESSWATFFAERRLRFILAQSEETNGKDKELKELIETTSNQVVPRLLGNEHMSQVKSVVVHGDLWSGNTGGGKIFDPSAFYGHNEYEMGIMKMFGGFEEDFLQEYHRICPKSEPVDEYDDRVFLYELYHHLNHYVSGNFLFRVIHLMI
jgi:protein-ribulosamine 3-kinase